MLKELLKIIETERLYSISKAAKEIGVSTELIRIMLDDLQRRGFINKVAFGGVYSGTCRGCKGCGGISGNNGSAGLRVWEITAKKNN
ncbi:MAG: hypothetical protein JEZ04_22125 [Spirochaetales bacterium]|nr:hypothetical protein [Spirochaetales bacterium]